MWLISFISDFFVNNYVCFPYHLIQLGAAVLINLHLNEAWKTVSILQYRGNMGLHLSNILSSITHNTLCV